MSVGGERFTVDVLPTIVYIYDYIYSAYTFIYTHIPNPLTDICFHVYISNEGMCVSNIVIGTHVRRRVRLALVYDMYSV